MQPLDSLRLAAALVHTVPGAELRFRSGRGEPVIVGRHRSADIDPCAFRQAVVAARSLHSNEPINEHFRAVHDLVIGGTLHDVGGGIYLTSCDVREQRWVASLLPFARLSELLTAIGGPSAIENVFHARVKPDIDLDVTVVAISTDDRASGAWLDEVAAQAAAALFAEELAVSLAAAPVASSSMVDDRTGGQS